MLRMISNHLKMLQSSLYRLDLFLRASRLFRIRRLRPVIVFPLDDPVRPLNLSDIRVCHMESVLFLHPRLNLFVRSPLTESGHVHVFERKFNSDILTRYVSLGKLDNSLNSCSRRKISTNWNLTTELFSNTAL